MPKQKSADRALARARASGYKRGAHEAKDSQPIVREYSDQAKRDQKFILDKYVTWSYGEFEEEREEDRPCPLDLESVEAYVLREQAPVPPLHKVTDFLRFYLKQSKGHMKQHATYKSTKMQAVVFFSGFTRVTGTPVDEKFKQDVADWIRDVLCKEGDCVNASRPKHNFDPNVLVRNIGWKSIE